MSKHSLPAPQLRPDEYAKQLCGRASCAGDTSTFSTPPAALCQASLSHYLQLLTWLLVCHHWSRYKATVTGAATSMPLPDRLDCLSQRQKQC